MSLTLSLIWCDQIEMYTEQYKFSRLCTTGHRNILGNEQALEYQGKTQAC